MSSLYILNIIMLTSICITITELLTCQILNLFQNVQTHSLEN